MRANYASAGNYPAVGGGIAHHDGELTLTNSTVSGNSAYARHTVLGGGISNSGGDVRLINSTVGYNKANTGYYGSAQGGGIWNSEGDMTLTNSTVHGNLVDGNYYDGFGGGIANEIGYVALINTEVRRNRAYGRFGGGGGGGIAIAHPAGAYVTLTQSTVAENRAGSGGGIWNGWGEITLISSTVVDNFAYNNGGGIRGSNLTITNSTVSGNTASGGVGGISAEISTITNSTVSGNSGSAGVGGVSGYNLAIANTIMAYNFGNNCSGSLDSLGHNLADDDSCGLTAPGDLVVADAMLGPLQDNSGPTETHALLPGSPAIDAGSPDCPPPATDQRGIARPQGAACDVGAVEYLPEPSGWLLLATGVSALWVIRGVS